MQKERWSGKCSNKMTKKQNRSEVLIADFVDGFAQGWMFAVPDAFRGALDIKMTERVKKGIKRLCWTQGNQYAFAEGDILYDNPAAYTDWDQAMKKINRVCQVIRATPCSLNNNREVIHGAVFFQLFEPNINKTELLEGETHHCTQAEFVKYLKTGHLR